MFAAGGIAGRQGRPATPGRRARGRGRRAAPRPAARRRRRRRRRSARGAARARTQMRRPSCLAKSSARRTSSRSASFSSMRERPRRGLGGLGRRIGLEPGEGEEERLVGHRLGVEVEAEELGVEPLARAVRAARLALLGEADLAVQHRQVARGVVVDGGVDDALHAHRERVLHGVRHVDVEAGRGEDRRAEAALQSRTRARCVPGRHRGSQAQPAVDLVAHARLDGTLHAFTILRGMSRGGDRVDGWRVARTARRARDAVTPRRRAPRASAVAPRRPAGRARRAPRARRRVPRARG